MLFALLVWETEGGFFEIGVFLHFILRKQNGYYYGMVKGECNYDFFLI